MPLSKILRTASHSESMCKHHHRWPRFLCACFSSVRSVLMREPRKAPRFRGFLGPGLVGEVQGGRLFWLFLVVLHGSWMPPAGPVSAGPESLPFSFPATRSVLYSRDCLRVKGLSSRSSSFPLPQQPLRPRLGTLKRQKMTELQGRAEPGIARHCTGKDPTAAAAFAAISGLIMISTCP